MSPLFWTQIGLGLNIIGGLILFRWGPPQETFDSGRGLEVEGLEWDEADRRMEKLKDKYLGYSGVGLALIIFGFLFQLFATFLS